MKLSRDDQDKHIAERLVGYDVNILTDLWESLSIQDYRDSLPHINCPTAIFYAGIMPSCMEEAANYYEAAIPAPVRKNALKMDHMC